MSEIETRSTSLKTAECSPVVWYLRCGTGDWMPVARTSVRRFLSIQTGAFLFSADEYGDELRP
jgi:hypothetical protein